MMTATEYPHIERDEQGRLFVKGTGFKVLVLLRDHTAWNWGPVQMHRQHPGLSLAQVHAILAYYYDHKEEIDRKLAEQDAEVEKYKASNPVSPVVERLRKLKQERSVIKGSVDELSRDERLALTLYYFEGLKLSEVADVLRTTRDEVHSMIERALSLLSERLQEESGEVVRSAS